jgi:hypothetical protein
VHAFEPAVILRQDLIAGEAGIRKKTGCQGWIGDIVHHQPGHLPKYMLDIFPAEGLRLGGMLAACGRQQDCDNGKTKQYLHIYLLI